MMSNDTSGYNGRAVGVLLAGVIVACVASWGSLYGDFEMANPDYLGFREIARWFFDGQTPTTYKRMPGYPALIGLLGQVLPVDRPYLHAGLLANLVCSAGALVLLYRLARIWVGAASVVVVIITAAAPYFSLLACQPLLEPWLLVLVLASLLGADRGAGWAFVTAAVAAVTRHEGAAMIPIVWAVRMHRTPRRWTTHTLQAAAAAVPFVAWTALTAWLGRDAQGAAYLQEMSGMRWHLGWNNIPLMLYPFRPDPRLLEEAAMAIPAVIGVIVALKRRPGMTLAVLAYWALYTAVHLVFSVHRARYAYPVLFVTPLFAVIGGQWLLEGFWKRVGSARWARIGAGVIGLCAGAWVVNAWMDFGGFALTPWQSRALFSALPAALLAAMFAAGLCLARPRPIAAALGLILAGLLAVPVVRAAGERAMIHSYERHANVEYRCLADWLIEHTSPGECVLVYSGYRLGYWDHLPIPARIISGDDLRATTHEAFLAELHEQGVDYVAAPGLKSLATNPDQPNHEHGLYWYHHNRTALFEPFRHGGPVASFQRVAELALPPHMNPPHPPSFIYRVIRKAPHD